jgi:hypothetical protein
VPPWGPTWVDDQPWGFVPFHYGRWAVIEGRWGWVPGDPAQDAVYAPALVAFIGSPDDASMTDDGGQPAVGWVPLGPDEPYDPWYTNDPAYIERVNAANFHDFHHLSPERLAELRRDRRMDGFANNRFATVVSRAAFVGARPVAASMVHIGADRLSRVAVVAAAPHLGMTEGRHYAPDPAAKAEAAGHEAGGHEAGGAHPEAGGREPGAGLHEPGVGHPSANVAAHEIERGPSSANSAYRGPAAVPAAHVMPQARPMMPQARPAFAVPNMATRPMMMARPAPVMRAAPSMGGGRRR